MANTNTKVNEDVQVPDHDVSGMGSIVPGPVDTGDTARAQDNMADCDADVAIVRGQPVQRSAVLRALIAQLQCMDQIDLDRIANELDANQDYNVDPANSVPDLQGINLQSISVKEDIAEIFAGETLTEEFKEKTALIFETAVSARVAVVTEELREAQEIQISEAVEAVTEQLETQLDRYISFAAESYVTDNTPVLEQTLRSVAAEKFMEGVVTLAEQFNIDIPKVAVDVVENLNAEIDALKTQLNEAIDVNVDAASELKSLRKDKIFEEVSRTLTAPQKDRLRALTENMTDSDTIETFRSNVETLSESVVATAPARRPAAPIDADSGIIVEGTDDNFAPNTTSTERSVFSVLERMKH